MIKSTVIVIIAVILLLSIGIFTGLIPLTALNDIDTKTDNRDRDIVKGTGELIGPSNRKGFITSYKNDGFSESISCVGKVEVNLLSLGQAKKYKYLVYGLKDNSWDLLSKPGKTSRYLSKPNPGEKTYTGLQIGGTRNADAYEFEIVGPDYDALRVEFYVYLDGNVANPLDGYDWWLVQRDEAYLYEGYGGLYLPRDEDGRPRSTFEVGETVDIQVETSYGGQVLDEGKTWRVALIEPADRGGNEIKHTDYGDNVDSTFSFTVTSDMYSKNSNNRYQIKIYNTLLPKGTLNVNSIDVLARAPSDVTFDGPTQSKVGDEVSITLSAEVNSDTQLDIAFFEVSVIYGNGEVLLPSSPTSNLWLINTYDYDATDNKVTVSFTPDMESYVTVHSKAYDTEGRASVHTKTWTLWAYANNPVPGDTIDDEVGENDYAGGQTSGWWPWDPSGFWENSQQTILIVIVCIVIFIVFAVLAYIVPQPPLKILMIILGVSIPVLLFIMWSLGWFLL